MKSKELIYEYKSNDQVFWTKKMEFEDFGSFVFCKYYYLRNGQWFRVQGKGIRLMKKVKTNSKGRFLIFEGKKFYI
jgi:hypothetical protein